MNSLPLSAAFAAILALPVLISIPSCSPPADSVPAADLVVNGNFAAEAEGNLSGWELIRTPVPGSKPLDGFGPNAPSTALHIVDAGGVKQTLKGLKKDQAYRLTFRGWRRGGDWAPKPTLTIGGIPLELQREILPKSADSEEGRNLELFTIDQLVRPGAGDCELKIEVSGDIVGLSRYSEVWLEKVDFTPVKDTAELLNYPIGAIAFRERAILRAGRTETIGLQLSNPVDAAIAAKVKLVAPAGVKVLDPPEREVTSWERRDVYAPFIQAYGVPRKVPEKSPSATLTWRVEADKPGDYDFVFEVAGERLAPLTVKLGGTFEPARENTPNPGAVPAPVKADTGGIKVGAMFYPGWMPGTGWGWNLLDPYPNRKPALGYYDDTIVEVMDWQIKWALEHGVSFFNVCWYRTQGNEGQPVTAWLNETLERGLLKSSFIDQFEFALTWENHNMAGVSSLEDLLQNLMPHWIEKYFKHPSYLRFDGKPVLFIYSMDRFIEHLGGVSNARAALVTDATAEAKFSNEQGLRGTTRFLKNVAGMWLLQECKRNWESDGEKLEYESLVAKAAGTHTDVFIDPDAPEFARPCDMPAVIAAWLGKSGQTSPDTRAGITRVIFESLALKYRQLLRRMKDWMPDFPDTLHVVGGGSRNALLNQMTADASGLRVLAGPSEATALGNVVAQMIARGDLASLEEGRALIRESFEIGEFVPRDTAAWDAKADRFAKISSST